MQLQLMLMLAELKIMWLQLQNGVIFAVIAQFLTNQIARIVLDFKMNNIININIKVQKIFYWIWSNIFNICVTVYLFFM
jgi:hypothetical protein